MNKNTLNIILITGAVLVLIALLIGISEILEAKNYCDSDDGRYKIKNFEHTCDDELLVKTTSGWIKESEILDFNISFEK